MKKLISFLAFSTFLHFAAALAACFHGMVIIGCLFAVVAFYYLAVLCLLVHPPTRRR